MSSIDRSESWTAVALDALWWLRPIAWAALFCMLWFAVVAPAQADIFPFPPPGTGCPANTSCIPGGGFPGGGNPGQCTPNPNGNPGCNGAGNPVDIITGNKYQHEIDLAPLPGEMGLHFSRHYNSNSTHRGLTGVGWRSSYEVVLVDLGSALQIIDADGRRLTFDRQTQHPGLCVGARPEDGRVIVDDSDKESAGRTTKPTARTYRWQRLDGSEYIFSSGSGDGHPLQSIRAASGATTTLTYLGGALDSVRDAQGRTLRFIYSRPVAAGSMRYRMLALAAIDTPVGRISYQHDENGRLQTVTQPNGLVRRYHYEAERQGTAANTWALTGISIEYVQDGQPRVERLATYTYNAQGRAIRTQHGGADDLKLEYGPRAATTITTGDGARTVYRHALVAGQWQTVEAIGPGCSTCPASNVRYRYRIDGPQAGQLEATLQLDARGQPVQQQRIAVDAWGRPTRVEIIGYVNGKPNRQTQAPAAVLRVQYEPLPPDGFSSALSAAQYAALWRPRLVARPSLVEGFEHSIAFSYNAYLQPVAITEAGASPLDGDGNLAPSGLTRTTSFRYAWIANASRLIALDGPLPGSADTRTFHYDELGRLRLVQHPAADLQERYAYDEAGRIVWRLPLDAVAVRTAFDASGEPSAWQRGDARVSIERDTLGRPLRIELPDGEVRWIGHGGPGGLGAVISNRGWGQWRVPTPRAAQHLLGNDTARNSEQASSATTARSSPASAWGSVTTQRDDFGRVVTLRTQATGLEVRRYDLADRLIERRFADGGIWRYERDAAGRIVAHAVTAPNAPTVITRVQWFGAYPIRVEHPNETETRHFDAAGRVAERSIERASGVRFAEQFAYDAADRLLTHTLPEGGALNYTWGIGTQLRAIDYRSPLGATQSLIAPLSEQTIDAGALTSAQAVRTAAPAIQVKGVATPAAGGYRYGNGIEARWQLNAARQLASLEHRATAVAGNLRASWWQSLFAWLPAAWAASEGSLVDAWRYDYDAVGRMDARTDVLGNATHSFAYDARGRLAVSQRQPNPAADPAAAHPPAAEFNALEYYAYDARGATLGRRAGTADQDFRRIAIGRNASGLPNRIGSRTLVYSADRRLTEVIESGQILARYQHNTHGERIGKHDAAHGATDYLFARQQLVAETVPNDPALLARRYVYAHNVPVAVIHYPHGQRMRAHAAASTGPAARAADYGHALLDRLAGRAAQIVYLHANEIGTPVAATNSAQRVLWRAQHRIYGEAQITNARAAANTVRVDAFTFNLRLPGQYWDAETGWHDNYLRTYDPARGQYLEPDPLGPLAQGAVSLTQPFAYANQNPLIYTDPLGLILFAFDGSDRHDRDLNVLSNVVDFRELYRDGEYFYMTGVGTRDTRSGIQNPLLRGGNRLDSISSLTGKERIDRLILDLRLHSDGVDDNTAVDIDVIGFSRGAAQARDFANQIAGASSNGFYRYTDSGGQQRCQRVNFRFMGLWDTVLSVAAGSYNLGIPAEFKRVSQAVALNEHRSVFPLESIMGDAVPPLQTRIERGFLGAHSDIGGGYHSSEDDLAKVALVWMVDQARAAGVTMAEPNRTIRADPIVHDQVVHPREPGPIEEDRVVRFRDGRTQSQRTAAIGGMSYADTLTYIRAADPPRFGIAGTVDMAGYLDWLNRNGYDLNMTIN